MDYQKKATIINNLIADAQLSDTYRAEASVRSVKFLKKTKTGKENTVTEKKRQLTLIKLLGFSSHSEFNKHLLKLYKQTPINKGKTQQKNTTKKTLKEAEKNTFEKGGNLTAELTFNKVERIIFLWGEFGKGDYNKKFRDFKNFEDLDKFYKDNLSEKTVAEHNGNYIKTRLEIVLSDKAGKTFSALPRVDVGAAPHDFNPYKQTIISYLYERYKDKNIDTDENTKVKVDFSNYLPKKEEKTDYEKEVQRQKEQGIIDDDTEGISILGLSQGKDNPIEEGKKEQEKKTNISINTSSYKNQYELNKAIEKLLKEKGTNPKDYSKEEKEFISNFSGYGGLFEQGFASGEDFNNKYKFEYFTPDAICETMVKLAIKHGYKENQTVLEPSAGIGSFLKYFSEKTPITTYEINPTQYKILKILYPNATHKNEAFEKMFLSGHKGRTSLKGKIENLEKFNLVIGNPPYGDYDNIYASYGEKSHTKAQNYIDYFISRGLDVTEAGGLLIFVVGAELANGGRLFTDKPMYKAKELISQKADLIDAYKLWQGAFAQTDVMTEILVFRKK